METDFNKLLQTVIELNEKKLSERMVEAIKQLRTNDDKYESETINELATALAKAQGEFKEIGSNRSNNFLKSSYTDLYGLLSPIRPILAKYNLAITQQIKLSNDGMTILHTKLIHASGQWIECRMRIIPLKSDIQQLGSAITYNRRYAIMAILGLADPKDALDDDGEANMSEGRDVYTTSAKPGAMYAPQKESYETITKEQIEELTKELEDLPTDMLSKFFDAYKITSLADVPKSRYYDILTRIRTIKQRSTK